MPNGTADPFMSALGTNDGIQPHPHPHPHLLQVSLVVKSNGKGYENTFII